MILDILDVNGAFGTPNAYVDVAAYAAYGVEFDSEDINGPNVGKSILGDDIIDVVAHKYSYPFVSMPMSLADSRKLRALVQQKTFMVRTDLFTGAVELYKMKSTNQNVKLFSYTRNRGHQVRVSFPLIEV